MKIPEHLALSYLIAQLDVQQHYGSAGTALVMLAGFLPDLDGLTLLAGWRPYRLYHRKVGHGILVALAGPLVLAAAAVWLFRLGSFGPLWFWLQISLVSHLATDICFYRWPVQLFWPFSTRGWEVGLLSWNDLGPTIVLYAGTAAALLWPVYAPIVAAVAIGLVAVYLFWRAWQPVPVTSWESWLAGGWARQNSRIWRWLTGDFVT